MTLAPSAPETPTLLPPRLRAALAGATIAAHLGLVAALGLSAPPPQILAPLNIEAIPEGDYFVDTAQVAGAAEQPPSPEQPAPSQEMGEAGPPQAAPEAVQPPSARLAAASQAPNAELAAQEQSRESEAKARAAAAEQARERRKRERSLHQRQQERLAEKRLAEAREARAGGGSQAHRAGRRDGQAARGAMANYPLLVAAELNRHKAYPAAARGRGETGTVGASFTVGASGRIVAHRITRSSGSSALDGAVRAMMASTHAPPPPGGVFHGNIAIHFNLSR